MTNYAGTIGGGYFSSANPALVSFANGTGPALYGATIGTNNTAGIVGESNNWHGGLFRTRDSSKNGAVGLVGANFSKLNLSTGVLGLNAGNIADSMYVGVKGFYNSDTTFGIGVLGNGFGGVIPPKNSDIGVYGSSDGVGVYGRSNNNIGVLGEIIDSVTTGNYGVASIGRSITVGASFATGTKSAIIPTSKGNQLVYCAESPEIWFEDFGNAKIVNGVCKIELDPLFLETVKIDETHPMVITVTPLGNCNGLYVVPGTTSFEVHELNNGSNTVSFSYRISAKRLHYENVRFGVAPALPKSTITKQQKREGLPTNGQLKVNTNTNLLLQQISK